MTDDLPAIVAQNIALRSFLLRLLDPEDLGHAVTQEVRAEVQRLVLPRSTVPAAQ
jgi:hypothetical protein